MKETKQTEIVGDVWILETPLEEYACEEINLLYERARNGSVSARNVLKKIYEDDWQTIKERMDTEGSAWYVWHMDGVRKYIASYL